MLAHLIFDRSRRRGFYCVDKMNFLRDRIAALHVSFKEEKYSGGMKVLVTGGAGYIGSHTIVGLLDAGHDVVVVDNLVTSSGKSIARVTKMTGKEVALYALDIFDRGSLESVFREHVFDAVIHFAALKAVGNSVARPLSYYQNNVAATIALLHVMESAGVKRLVYSSSACVYGKPEKNPVTEDAPLNPENPYGHTKVVIENMLRNVAASGSDWSFTSLRYFNPIGAHESGFIGDDQRDAPENLLPYVEQVAVGKRPHLMIFGDDYDTPDGTCIRDYIHIMDLSSAHVSALEHIEHPNEYKVYNISTGKGTSVFEVHAAYEQASGRKIPFVVTKRRDGDVQEYYGDPSLAQKEIGWKATRSILQGCEDSWRWKKQNPDGYASPYPRFVHREREKV